MARRIALAALITLAACGTGDETAATRNLESAAPNPSTAADPTAGHDQAVAAAQANHDQAERERVAVILERMAANERAARAARTTTTRPAVTYQRGAADGCGGWRWLVAQHFRPGDHNRACRILWCESKGDPNAVSPSGRHNGLFQIAGGSFDPATNVAHAARMAYTTPKSWTHWSCR